MNNFAVQTTNCIKYSKAKLYISDIVPLQTRIEQIKLSSKKRSNKPNVPASLDRGTPIHNLRVLK